MYIELGFLVVFLVGAMVLYFGVAERFGIIDRANERSSHILPTVRGGGVVFVLSLLVWFCMHTFFYPWFVAGAVLIALISFADDIRARPPLLRFTIQFIAFLLLGWQVNLFQEAWWLVVLVLIVGIGAINAFNFMDGINGITGVYAFINLVTFYLIDKFVVSFTTGSLIMYLALATLVFLFFNFRKRARCFAGDVGSITIAFIQLFLCLQLIQVTGNYGWVLLFLVYGCDSVLTIVYRLKKKENIFKPHRTHLYQYLANELKIDHRLVSVLYALLQAGVNLILVLYLPGYSFWFPLLVLGLGGVFFWVMRSVVVRKVILPQRREDAK